jgi:hypothetical protein
MLKEFYKNADWDCYLNMAQKNMEAERDSIKVWWYGNYPQIFDESVPVSINLRQEKTIPMLVVNFSKTEMFNYENNIYDYMIIDSMRVFTFACVKNNSKVWAFANFFGGRYAYCNIDENLKGYSNTKRNALKNVIRGINRHSPELILYCASMAGFHDDNGFMFVKNDQIFVFRVIERDVYELNEYIRKFFNLDRIINLNKENTPAIYDKNSDNGIRKTGNTPQGEINVCTLSAQ